MAFNPRIAVISLGNPDALFRTFHSAGHHALQALQSCIYPPQPALRRSAHGAQPCQASEGSKYTLIQSPTYMNVSGPFVGRVWKELATQAAREGRHAGMVIVHDEMEKAFGEVALRDWSRGRRGHNGLRSIDQVLNYKQWKERGARWATVGVGIGRPENRDNEEVSRYVLSKMGRHQLSELAQAGGHIIDLLVRFEKDWEKELLQPRQ